MHSFIDREIISIRNWQHWKELWDKATQFEFLHSLLHFGFDVPTSDDETTDRYLFYLRLADGHAVEQIEGHPMEERRAREQKWWKLSAKAFDVLYQRFFKDFAALLATPLVRIHELEVLTTTLEIFARGETHQWRNIPRYSEDHRRDTVLRFLHRLVEQFWPMGRTHPELRPKFIETLVVIDKLDVLLTERFCVNNLNIQDNCLAKLEDLALQVTCRFPTEPYSRHPYTVEEAAYGCVKAAQILVNLRVIRAQQDHFDMLRERRLERTRT